MFSLDDIFFLRRPRELIQKRWLRETFSWNLTLKRARARTRTRIIMLLIIYTLKGKGRGLSVINHNMANKVFCVSE